MNRINPQPQNQTQELSDFYQEVIIDHFKRPRFKGRIMDCRFCQEGKNPLCGDVVSIYCKVLQQEAKNNTNFAASAGADTSASDVLLQVHFEASGCSISQASASIMCELIQNKNVQEAKEAILHAEQIYTGQQKVDPENMESDMDALHGIGQFPARVKCAALPWKTLECLIAENFDDKGCPLARSCEKHLSYLKQKRKLRVVSTELEQ